MKFLVFDTETTGLPKSKHANPEEKRGWRLPVPRGAAVVGAHVEAELAASIRFERPDGHAVCRARE